MKQAQRLMGTAKETMVLFLKELIIQILGIVLALGLLFAYCGGLVVDEATANPVHQKREEVYPPRGCVDPNPGTHYSVYVVEDRYHLRI